VYTRAYRIPVVILLVGSLFAVGDLFSVSSPAAASTPAPVHQYNLCSNTCRSQTPNDPADLVIYQVGTSNPRPWSVTLNEVCSPEYLKLLNALDSYGYSPVRTVTVSVGGTCNQYGNAMFVLGNPILTKDEFPLSSSTELRKLTCQRVELFGAYVFCVSHTAPDQASAHSAQILYIMNGNYGARRRMFGGDLNLVPGDLPAGWYNGYSEVDPASRRTYTAISPLVKIDYAFLQRTAPASHYTGPPYCDPSFSDHCYLVGAFLI